jgi:hypothetical protein
MASLKVVQRDINKLKNKKALAQKARALKYISI